MKTIENGEGAHTGCGLNNFPVGKTFQSMSAMLGYVASAFGLSTQMGDYDTEGNYLQTSKTVANHSEAQNGGWFDPTPTEYQKWREGKLKLYSENFAIHFLRVI